MHYFSKTSQIITGFTGQNLNASDLNTKTEATLLLFMLNTKVRNE